MSGLRCVYGTAQYGAAILGLKDIFPFRAALPPGGLLFSWGTPMWYARHWKPRSSLPLCNPFLCGPCMILCTLVLSRVICVQEPGGNEVQAKPGFQVTRLPHCGNTYAAAIGIAGTERVFLPSGGYIMPHKELWNSFAEFRTCLKVIFVSLSNLLCKIIVLSVCVCIYLCRQAHTLVIETTVYVSKISH